LNVIGCRRIHWEVMDANCRLEIIVEVSKVSVVYKVAILPMLEDIGNFGKS